RTPRPRTKGSEGVVTGFRPQGQPTDPRPVESIRPDGRLRLRVRATELRRAVDHALAAPVLGDRRDTGLLSRRDGTRDEGSGRRLAGASVPRRPRVVPASSGGEPARPRTHAPAVPDPKGRRPGAAAQLAAPDMM